MNFTIALLYICFIYGVPEAYSPNGCMGIDDPALLERFLSVVNMIALISSAFDCIALKCSRLKHETWYVSLFLLTKPIWTLSFKCKFWGRCHAKVFRACGAKKIVLWPQRVHVPLLPRTGQPCHSLLRVLLTGSYLLVDDHCCDVKVVCVLF